MYEQLLWLNLNKKKLHICFTYHVFMLYLLGVCVCVFSFFDYLFIQISNENNDFFVFFVNY